MNTAKLRSKRVVVTTAAIAALAVGGGIWGATAAGADAEVSHGDRDRVGNAAVQAVGGGTVVDVETSDDQGEAYEAEVRKPDGTEVDVVLDQDLKVLSQRAGTPDAPAAALTETQRTSAGKAALDAVGGGSVLDVETSDDQGAGFDVEVRDPAGQEWDVELDPAFKVLAQNEDD